MTDRQERTSNMSDWSTRDDEKRRREYYQQIVYDVCNLIGGEIVCGTVDSPTTQVQDRVREMVQPKGTPSHPCAEEQLSEIKAILAKEQERDSWHHHEHQVSALVRRVMERKADIVAGTIARCREFQQDVLTFMRAFSLMLETVGGASTHSEKAARLRGLVELVESAARKIRERQFKESQSWSYSMADDVFRSDYPVRHWIDKAREAEAMVAALEAKLNPPKEDANGDGPTKEEVPF